MIGCLNVDVIKSRLLSPANRSLLEKYTARYLADPDFLYYHRSSVTLELRHELGMGFGYTNGIAHCSDNHPDHCHILSVLKEVIEEQLAVRVEKANSAKR